MAEETPGPADLELVNCSVTFLLLIILAVLLSLAGLLRQRQLLRAILAGEATDRCPEPYPLQRAAGAISVGALEYRPGRRFPLGASPVPCQSVGFPAGSGRRHTAALGSGCRPEHGGTLRRGRPARIRKE